MGIYISGAKSRKKVLHKPGCFMIHKIAEENKEYFDSLREGQNKVYHLCQKCISMIKNSVSPTYIKKMMRKKKK